MSMRSCVVDGIWRGLRRILRLRETIADRLFDMRFGTDTAQWAELEDLEIDSEHLRQGKRYQPTGTRRFRKLMGQLEFPEDSVFVDLGSGKGKVLILASEYPFKRVVGLEFSHELCEIAARNISAYRDKVGRDPAIEIVETDVTDYPLKDDENVFFLANSFQGEVLSEVVANMAASFDRNPRKMWLIYAKPVFHEIVEAQGMFDTSTEYRFGLFDDPFGVYVASP